MKKIIFALCLFGCINYGCTTTKTTTGSSGGSAPSNPNARTNTDNMNMTRKLNGNWVLDYIAGGDGMFETIYADKKPTIAIDVTNNKFTGNTSCNSYNGVLVAYGDRVSFSNSLAMTKMMCPGQGESLFVEKLKQASNYFVSDDDRLTVMAGDSAVLRFVRR